MSSARCPDCSAPLLVKMDGSSAVCPSCGREFPCTASEFNQPPVEIPDRKLGQLAAAFGRTLEQFLCQKGDISSLNTGYQELSSLPDLYKSNLAMRFAASLMDACRRINSPALWKPFLQGIAVSDGIFEDSLYQKVMCCGISSLGNGLITPVEQALVSWRQRPDSQRNPAKALEILESCNTVTQQILEIVDSDFLSQHQERFETPLMELFDRLNSISWDMEALSCTRPAPGNPHQSESYTLLSDTNFIAQRNALFRNRSIVDNRKYQLRRCCSLARQQRRKAYWKAHPEQYAELENRWVELRMDIAALRRKISLCPQIARMQEIQSRLNQLSLESASLGLLQYRQKAEIRAEETALNEEFSQLDQQFNEIEKQTENQISVLQEELDRVTKELDGVVL